MVLDYPFVWPLWNAAENSQRQVCKQSLTLSESTTRDGLCSASDTPQEALRPTSCGELIRGRYYPQIAPRKGVCGELIRGRYYPQIAPRKGDASPLLNGPGDSETIGVAKRTATKSAKSARFHSRFLWRLTGYLSEPEYLKS